MANLLRNTEPNVAAGAIVGGVGGTGTVVSGSVSINFPQGVITTASLTTGTASITNFDLKNSYIGTASVIEVTLVNSTNTTGQPVIGPIVQGTAGSITIGIVNADSTPAGSALNGVFKVNFSVLS